MEIESEDLKIPCIDCLIHCDINKWYPRYKSVTFPTEFIPVPQGFVEYITSDQVYAGDQTTCFDDWEDSDDENWRGHVDDEETLDVPITSKQFPDIEATLQQCVVKWGNIFPKLNWSSPKDVHWMSIDGTIKCNNMEQLMLLFKSSDYIRFDIKAANQIKDMGKDTVDLTLAFRKYHEIRASNLFRCFVKDNKLIGISQLNCMEFFAFLLDEKDNYKVKIDTFYRETLMDTFLVDRYAFDVYIHSNGKIYLVDISPFHESYIDPLLFTWEELEELNGIEPVLKVVETNFGVQPNFPKMISGLPYELANIAEFSELVGEDGKQPKTIEELAEFLK